MSVWSFYDPATGRLVGRTYSGPAQGLAINTPPGLAAIEGEHDHRTHRVTLETGQVDQWRDPPPSADHDWDPDVGAWRMSRRAQRRAALAGIVNLEMQQLRPLREILVDPSNQVARNRLAEIETRIAELRATLRAD